MKHRWSIAHNYLSGITAGDWWRLLCENRFSVSPVYWHRAAAISMSSVVNSYYRRKEERLYAREIEQVQIREPPIFILGHWRSGTTLLHYLFAQDAARFAFANTYQVVNPHTFLCTEATFARRFARFVPTRRPMDNMELGMGTPQEDEFAPLLMTLKSLYLGISFPRREAHYSRYLSFAGVPRAEIDAWKNALHWFCRKLTYKYSRRLVMKSPPHTARVRLLLEIFPEARFVHIHRDPYRVFQSQRHFFDTAIWYTYLQRADRSRVDEGILSRYSALYDAYFNDLSLIPAGRLHEVRFDELERDPLATMRTIYDKLQLGDFSACEPALRQYTSSLAGYKKNEFAPLPAADRRRVATAWKRSFETWGYEE
jgi:omega-hydroxy-beta-dihydromenaquinone-9 sulfotransferase